MILTGEELVRVCRELGYSFQNNTYKQQALKAMVLRSQLLAPSLGLVGNNGNPFYDLGNPPYKYGNATWIIANGPVCVTVDWRINIPYLSRRPEHLERAHKNWEAMLEVERALKKE